MPSIDVLDSTIHYEGERGPLVYLHSQDQFTLSLGLQFYRSQQGAQWHLLMAASTVVIAPVIVLFFFTQRLFIQGIAATGLKG